MYTGQITFATLGSQGVTTVEEVQDGCSQGERKPLHGLEGLGALPPGVIVVEPCSPKSVYYLADKVRLAPPRSDAVTNSSFTQVSLTGLCDITFKDIQSKLDKNNIVHELFSPFTAKSVIPQLSMVSCADVASIQPQAYQRNGTRALPV